MDNPPDGPSIWRDGQAFVLSAPRAIKACIVGESDGRDRKLGLSPDFLDGSFFRVTMLTDGRFHDLAMLGGGLAAADIEAYGAALDATLAGAPWADSAFHETARFRSFAGFLTGFTGLSELAIALCFLWPPGGLPARLRNPLLIGFAVATYAFATVRGFGWLLATMGAAQCRPDEPRARIAYVALVFLIEIYRSVPWTAPILEALGKF